MKKILSTFFVFSFLVAFSQQSKIDSLLSLLKKDKEDTMKVNHLNTLSISLHLINPDSTILLAQQAVTIAEKINFQKGEANAYYNTGVGCFVKGNYPKALESHFTALKIDEVLNYKEGIASNLFKIGVTYATYGQATKALDYYFKALKMDEELDNKKGIAVNLGNIGQFYVVRLGDYSKALDYFLKALKISEELGNKNKIALFLEDIGGTYAEQGTKEKSKFKKDSLLNKALDYLFKGLKTDEELGDKNGIAVIRGNIGGVYVEQGKNEKSKVKRDSLFNKALDCYFKALKTDKELGNKSEIATQLGNIGSLYTITGKFIEAEKYLKDALAVSTEINDVDNIKDHEQFLSELYDTIATSPLTSLQRRGEYVRHAFEHYKKYITVRDSIEKDVQKKKQMSAEGNYEFEKKEAITKAEQEKKDVITNEEKRRQKCFCFLLLEVCC